MIGVDLHLISLVKTRLPLNEWVISRIIPNTVGMTKDATFPAVLKTPPLTPSNPIGAVSATRDHEIWDTPCAKKATDMVNYSKVLYSDREYFRQL